jgi:flagellar protein FliS
MLYEACTVAVREARYHLAEGRIAERSREINKAYEILAELAISLDHQRGGEISQRLALLYDYMQRRRWTPACNRPRLRWPGLGLLSTLSEAWAGVRAPAAIAEGQAPGGWVRAPNPEAEAPSPWAQAPGPWAQAPVEEAAASRSYAWSL